MKFGAFWEGGRLGRCLLAALVSACGPSSSAPPGSQCHTCDCPRAGSPLFLRSPRPSLQAHHCLHTNLGLFPGRAGPARRRAQGVCASSPGASLCLQAPSVQHCLGGQPFHEGGATPLLAPPKQGEVAHVGRRRVGGSRGSCLELTPTLGQWRAWLAAWGLFTGLSVWSSQRLGQVPRRAGPEPPQRHRVCCVSQGLPGSPTPGGSWLSCAHAGRLLGLSEHGKITPTELEAGGKASWETILTHQQTLAVVGEENSFETLQLQKRGLPSKLQNQPQGGFTSFYFFIFLLCSLFLKQITSCGEVRAGKESRRAMGESAGCVSGLIQAGPAPERDQLKPGPYVGLIVGGRGGGHRSRPHLWGGVQTNTGRGPLSTTVLHRGRPVFPAASVH